MITTTRPARWATPDNIIDLATTAAAVAGVLFVTGCGIVLSYNALWDLASAAGSVNPILAWLWPLTLDALAIVASLNVLWAEIRKERDNYAWSLVIAFTLLSVIFNAVHASLANLLAFHPLAPAFVAGLVGTLPPIAAAFALHLLVRLLRRVLERVSVLSNLNGLQERISQAAGDLDRLQAETTAAAAEAERQITDLSSRRESIRAELETLRREKKRETTTAPAETSADLYHLARRILAERGPDISGSELGRLLGKSESLGRRLKRELAEALENAGAAPAPVGMNGNGHGPGVRL